MTMLSLALAVLSTTPQDPPATGQMMGQPLVVLGKPLSSELMLVEPDQPPEPMSTFDGRFVLGDMVPLPAGLEVSSFSRGAGAMTSDLVPTVNGYRIVPVVPDGGWSFVLFTVAGGGWDPGTAYAAEVAAGGTTAGDVWCYVLEGSEGPFVDEQVGVVMKVRDGAAMGYSGVVDLESFVPGYALPEDYGDDVDEDLGAGTLDFYFTLRTTGAGTYLSIPDTWGPAGTAWKDPTTVFRTRWNEGRGVWDTPTVHLTAVELELPLGTVIDGLSIADPEFPGAPGGQPGIEAVVSTTEASLERQIWVYGTWLEPGTSSPMSHRGPLTMPTGGLFVTGALGFDEDEQRLEAYCGDDPAQDWSLLPRHDLRNERVAFWNGVKTGVDTLDWSFHQVHHEENTNEFRYRVALQGFVGQDDRYALLYRAGGVGLPLAMVSRSTNSTTGDQRSAYVVLPRLGQPADLEIEWWVYDASGASLGVSRTMTIRRR